MADNVCVQSVMENVKAYMFSSCRCSQVDYASRGAEHFCARFCVCFCVRGLRRRWPKSSYDEVYHDKGYYDKGYYDKVEQEDQRAFQVRRSARRSRSISKAYQRQRVALFCVKLLAFA